MLSGILGMAGGGGGSPIGSTATMGDFAGSDAGSLASMPSDASSSDAGMGSKIMKLLKDPEVLKAFGKTASSLAGTIKAADEIPPQAHEMFSQVVAQQQAANRPASPEELGMLTPQMAQTILQQMGIPSGFTPLTGPRR